MKNKIILGTVQFGVNYGINNNKGIPNDIELNNILLTALNNNIQFLDTAEAYGNAQQRIGDFHKKNPNNKFNVITKFSENNFDGLFEKRILKDLDLLRVDNLYAYLFHNYKSLVKAVDKKNELFSLKAQGLIRKIGVSLYTNDEIENVLDNFDFIELIQIPFNLFDNINLRGDVLKKMKEKEIEIHTRSVFLQGLFFKKQLPEKLSVLETYLKRIKEISKKHTISIAELALNYCLNQPLIDKVLIGVDEEEQLVENLNSVRKLNNEVLEEVNEIFVKEVSLLNPGNWN